MSSARRAGLALLVGAVAWSARAAADENDPATPSPAVEARLGVRGVFSGNATQTYTPGGWNGNVDFSDTALFARVRAPLYNQDARAGVLIGMTFPDQYYEPGTIFLGEANGFLDTRWLTFRIGRTRVKTQIVPMPTLRDDDLVRFSDAQNPFSDGRTTADHQFANTIDLTFYPTPRLYLELHAENMPNFVLRPESLTRFELNSFGFGLGYKETQAESRLARVRKVGVGFNAYRLDLPTQRYSFELLAGLWMNVVADPVHNVDWRVQAIYNRGVDDIAMTSLIDTFRAEQMSVVTALGYTYRKRLLPTLRASLIGAYKAYIDQKREQYSIVANVFYSLGISVAVGVQYQFRTRARGIPEAFGDDFAHTFKLALVGAFETGTEPLFDERDSLLNTYSGYLP